MGQITHLVVMQRIALVLLLGFSLVSFVCLIFLSGRGRQSHYDGEPIPPIENYGNWVREGHGRVPLFLKMWMFAVAGIAVALTGIVIYHGYRY